MNRIAIIYFSASGSPRSLAAAIEQGATTVENTTVETHQITGEEIVKGRFENENCLSSVDSADAVIFGSPTYMGGPAAQFKAFADASSERWDRRVWSGKLAAGFTIGAYPAGDQLATLSYFNILACQHGMLWLGVDIICHQDPRGRNPLGTDLGLTAVNTNGRPSDTDLATAQHLGSRVARYCKRLSRTA